MRVPQAHEVSGATAVPCVVPPGAASRLLLATSVTAHLTHLVRPTIGTKMFSSHSNTVEEATHEEGSG